MFNKQPPSYDIRFMDLPLSRLHVLETGQGEPLIMVPATISELENWRTLAQFMGQWFHVYFFELPGHGKSSPFQENFSSHQVAKLVEQMADHLGLKRFNLMGFSFGGILAMRTYQRLAVTHRPSHPDRALLRPAYPAFLQLAALHAFSDEPNAGEPKNSGEIQRNHP